jgi:hypothetical protein
MGEGYIGNRKDIEAYLKALEKIRGYENQIMIENYFSDDIMIETFQELLEDYAEMMEYEHGGDWKDFRKYVNSGEITWVDSDHNYVITLHTRNIDVVSNIIRSNYFEYIKVDMSELSEEDIHKLFLDGIWKLYQYRDNVEKYSLEFLIKNISSMFKKITIDSVIKFVDDLDNFNEEEVLLWLKLQ